MKEFKDLDFGAHSAGLGGTHATMVFDNGYGVSVITGRMFYTSEEKPYEVAVTKGGSLCYDTPITNDVLGYRTEEEVTEIMKQVQEL